jgi:hypothetical protein
VQQITTLELVSIRDHGLDEYWLQDYICQNPSCLGLGDIELVSKEKKQSSGGRLDILMKGVDDELYEIEVMLGETDETHIIRTIEYWDIEKKKRPKRQHTAILVAERINTRFYNVINLLSYSVPIIGIQANLYRVGNDVSMIFTKIVDSFEEPEIEDEGEILHGFEFLKGKSPETAKVIETLTPIIVGCFSDHRINHRKNGATIFIGGERKMGIARRGNKQSSVQYKVSEEDRTAVEELLDLNSISYDYKNGYIRIWLNPKSLNEHIDVHRKIIEKL